MNCIVNVFRARQDQGRAVRGRTTDVRGARSRPRPRSSPARLMTRPPFTDADLDAMRVAVAIRSPTRSSTTSCVSRGIDDPHYLVQRLIAEHQRTLPPSEQIPSVRAYFAGPGPRCRSGPSASCCAKASSSSDVFGVHIASALFCALAADELHRSRRRAGPHAHDGTGLEHPPAARADRRDAARRHGRERRSDAPPFGPDTLLVPRAARRAAVPRRGPATCCATTELRRGGALGEPINQEDLLGHAHGVHRCRDRVARAVRRVVSTMRRSRCVRAPVVHRRLVSRHRSGALLSPQDRRPAHRCSGTSCRTCATRSRRRHAAPSDSGRLLMARAPRRGVRIAAVPLARTAARVHAPPHRVGVQRVPRTMPRAGWTRILLRAAAARQQDRCSTGVYYDLSGLAVRQADAAALPQLDRRCVRDPVPHPWRYEPIRRAWKLEPARATRATDSCVTRSRHARRDRCAPRALRCRALA